MKTNIVVFNNKPLQDSPRQRLFLAEMTPFLPCNTYSVLYIQFPKLLI